VLIYRSGKTHTGFVKRFDQWAPPRQCVAFEVFSSFVCNVAIVYSSVKQQQPQRRYLEISLPAFRTSLRPLRFRSHVQYEWITKVRHLVKCPVEKAMLRVLSWDSQFFFPLFTIKMEGNVSCRRFHFKNITFCRSYYTKAGVPVLMRCNNRARFFACSCVLRVTSCHYVHVPLGVHKVINRREKYIYILFISKYLCTYQWQLFSKIIISRFFKAYRVPRISNRAPRIRENYHRVPKIRENRVPADPYRVPNIFLKKIYYI